jgi:hypothetical protein
VRLAHEARRTVDQRPDVVHDRLIQLAERLRDELPPIEPGTQPASLLGIAGPLGVAIEDRGPTRIELRTTRGRITGNASADVVPTPDGRTSLTIAVVIEPHGFAADMMLGIALRARPEIERQVIDGLEAAMTDLATELAKPAGEWDPDTWRPVGLPTAG